VPLAGIAARIAALAGSPFVPASPHAAAAGRDAR
jgi:hypothetical protein